MIIPNILGSILDKPRVTLIQLREKQPSLRFYLEPRCSSEIRKTLSDWEKVF